MFKLVLEKGEELEITSGKLETEGRFHAKMSTIKDTHHANKFRKISSGHRTGKVQFSFQFQRKAMPKNTQTTTQLHSSHMLVMFKILQVRLQQYVNHELPDVQGGFRKGRGTEIKLPTSTGS